MTDTENKPEFPKKEWSASGGDFGWSVEVRAASYAEPFELLGRLVTNKWKKFEVVQGPSEDTTLVHVAARQSYEGVRERYGLLEYQEAQALRWSLHAKHEADSSFGGKLETRLVEHKLTYAYTCTPLAAHDEIKGEDRSAFGPFKGKRKMTPEELAAIGFEVILPTPKVEEPAKTEKQDEKMVDPPMTQKVVATKAKKSDK
jgi:hypothetical protein